MIYTNQMEAKFDYAAIERDFMIYEAERDEGNYYKSNVLDVPIQDCKARSAVYCWGKTCYFLYLRSDAERAGLKQALEAVDAKVCVREIRAEKLPEDILAQLLCNAIYCLQSRTQTYNNTMGSLYHMDSKWHWPQKGVPKTFYALRIKFTRDMCISLNVITFTGELYLQAKAGKPKYIFDPQSCEFRRLLKEDQTSAKDRYIQAAYLPDRKNTVPFLDFLSAENFRSSKAGVLQRFLCDVRNGLGNYLQLTPKLIQEGAHYPLEPRDDMQRLRTALHQQTVYLEDMVQTEKSHYLGQMLEKELQRYSGVELCKNNPQSGAFILRIIHNKESYVKTPEQDPHQQARTDCVIQHITEEDFNLTGKNRTGTKDKEDASLQKVIQELAIKADIKCRKVSVYDWPDFGASRSVSFVCAEMLGFGGNQYVRYKRLKIEPNGTMQFDQCDDRQIITGTNWEKIDLAYKPKGWLDREIEGLIYETPDEIQVIHQTERYTLPNLDNLDAVLNSTCGKEVLEIRPIIELVQREFQTSSPTEKEEYRRIQAELQAYGTAATRNELKKLLNLKSKLGKQLNQQIMDEIGVVIGNGIKQAQNWERYFGGMLDIRFYQQGTELFYFVGYSGKKLQSMMAHACRIRKVTATSGELNFIKYLPLLSVEFVRNGSYTVVPFPFKYLREWKNEGSNPFVSHE